MPCHDMGTEERVVVQGEVKWKVTVSAGNAEVAGKVRQEGDARAKRKAVVQVLRRVLINPELPHSFQEGKGEHLPFHLHEGCENNQKDKETSYDKYRPYALKMRRNQQTTARYTPITPVGLSAKAPKPYRKKDNLDDTDPQTSNAACREDSRASARL